MFAYCLNNPVAYLDISGEGAGAIIAILVVFTIVGAVMGYNNDTSIGAQSSEEKINTSTNASQRPSPPPGWDKYYYGNDPQDLTPVRTPSVEDTVIGAENKSLSQGDRVRNAFFGATLGLAVGGLTVACVGAAWGLSIGSMFTTIPALGGTAFQTAVRGILAYDAVTVFVAPFWGIEMETIELTP